MSIRASLLVSMLLTNRELSIVCTIFCRIDVLTYMVPLQIHKLNRKEDGSLEYVSTQSVESTTKSNVWRVAWNATGTVLATSAEDGTLSLWRRDFAGAWINVQNLPSGVQQKMMHYYQNP